jgi:hypothetical protein
MLNSCIISPGSLEEDRPVCFWYSETGRFPVRERQ